MARSPVWRPSAPARRSSAGPASSPGSSSCSSRRSRARPPACSWPVTPASARPGLTAELVAPRTRARRRRRRRALRRPRRRRPALPAVRRGPRRASCAPARPPAPRRRARAPPPRSARPRARRPVLHRLTGRVEQLPGDDAQERHAALRGRAGGAARRRRTASPRCCSCSRTCTGPTPRPATCCASCSPGCPTSGCSSSAPTAPTTCTAATRCAPCSPSSSGCRGSSASTSRPSTPPSCAELPARAARRRAAGRRSSRTSAAAPRATPTTPRSCWRAADDPGGAARGSRCPSSSPTSCSRASSGCRPASSSVARVASVAGRRVSDPLLRAAPHVDLPPTELDEALREAVAHHVLVADGADRYAFRHALLQEAVYGDLLPGERVRLHATYARLLAAGDGASAADLARHALAAHDLPGALGRLGPRGRRGRRRAGARRGARATTSRRCSCGPPSPRPRGRRTPTCPGSRWCAAAAAGGRRASTIARSRSPRGRRADRPATGTPEAGARSRLVHHLYDADRWDDAEREARPVRALLDRRGAVAGAGLDGRHRGADGRRPPRPRASHRARRTRPRRGARARARRPPRPTCSSASPCRRAARATSRPPPSGSRRRTSGPSPPATRRRAARGLQPGHQPDRQRRPRGRADASSSSGLAEAERAGLALTLYGTDSLLMLLQALVLAGEWDDALAAEARARRAGPARAARRAPRPLLQVHAARDPLAASRCSHAAGAARARRTAWGATSVLAPRADAQRWLGDARGRPAHGLRSACG